MDLETGLVNLAIAIFASLLAATITIRYALRAVRDQRAHEIKVRAYGRMLVNIRESVGIVGALHTLQTLKLGDKDQFMGNFLTMVGPLVTAGDMDTYYSLEDLENQLDLKNKKGALEFLEEMRNRVNMALTFQLQKNGREYEREVASLNFAKPNDEVSQALGVALGMFRQDWGAYGLRGLFRMAGIEGFPKEVDFQARERAFQEALEKLQAAMEKEVGQTI